jgi:hypothetical protein
VRYYAYLRAQSSSSGGQLTDLLIKQNMSRLMRFAQKPEIHDLHPVQATLLEAEDETPEDISKPCK